MQDILQSLLGGGQQRQEYQDFVNRYDQGHPSEGYSGQEVLDRYRHVAASASPQLYQESAEQAFARLSPHERAEFMQYLQQRAQQQNVALPMTPQGGFNSPQAQDPGFLAQLATQLHLQQPGMFSGLLGGLLGGGGNRGQPQFQGQQQGSILDNPIAKAALAGIAAMAVKNMMERRAA
jgi:hypothetical protein